jgi:hypothetical protein
MATPGGTYNYKLAAIQHGIAGGQFQAFWSNGVLEYWSVDIFLDE